MVLMVLEVILVVLGVVLVVLGVVLVVLEVVLVQGGELIRQVVSPNCVPMLCSHVVSWH